MASASPFDAALGDAVHRLHTAADELDRLVREADIAERAAALAVPLTGSSHAAVAVAAPSGGGTERIYSYSAERAAALDDTAAARLIASTGMAAVLNRRGMPGGNADGRLAVIGARLSAGGEDIGAIAVGRSADYTDVERHVLAIFASHVAFVLAAARLRQRRAEDARSVQRAAGAHETAVRMLAAVSSLAGSGGGLTSFYRRLARTLGELVGAEKVLFWRLEGGDTLVPAGGHGIDDRLLSALEPVPCHPDGDDLTSKVVFQDLVFRANDAVEPAQLAGMLERLGAANAIAAPWRAGPERLGLVAAYGSTKPSGFSLEDTWLLEQAGLAAGLVMQQWQTQEDLRKSVERLTKVDGARQMLLKNITTVVDKERKRFVAELHDDALQKLTAAELHLARVAPEGQADPSAVEAVTRLLEQTETALRRLVFEVNPPQLDAPDGLVRSVEDRLAMLAASGLELEVELHIPEDISLDLKALIFRQIAEAVSNVERHANATRVKIVLAASEGGVIGMVEDNGKGFLVAERSNLPGHLGLLALRERTLMAGGRYKIESEPGTGTRVEFWLPLGG